MGTLKLFFLNYLLFLLPIALHSAKTYNVGDRVPLFVNKIGPLHNPRVKHTNIMSWPSVVQFNQVLEKKGSLGEVLNGDRLANALYNLKFAVNKTRAVLCQQTFSKADIAKFRESIKNDF
ncbi:hypothetical protein OROHE_012200 [Orobanche hederae]